MTMPIKFPIPKPRAIFLKSGKRPGPCLGFLFWNVKKIKMLCLAPKMMAATLLHRKFVLMISWMRLKMVHVC